MSFYQEETIYCLQASFIPMISHEFLTDLLRIFYGYSANILMDLSRIS